MLSRRLMGETGFVSLTDRAEVGEGASLVLGDARGRRRRQPPRRRRSCSPARAPLPRPAAPCSPAAGSGMTSIWSCATPSPNGVSRQVWRSVADDQAACSVAARVEVARGAQKTDAEQSLKGLLLARSATINAKPELEIFADDVKCAHGATVGELDRAALFYLESRGVTPDEARALLTRAFVADALDRIGEQAVREAFYADAEGWFA